MLLRMILLGLAFSGIGSAALAQGSKSRSPPEFARAIDRLKPSEWVWAPEVAPEGPVLVYVDPSKQVAMVYRNGIRIAATTVSTGRPGHSTPTGVFTILQKDAKHRSSTYSNAPMPFQQRLTWDGVALHAGGLPGYPESHGCVHLPYEFARELFAITKLGGTVVVPGDAQHHVATCENSLLVPVDADGKAIGRLTLRSGEQFRWTPHLAPDAFQLALAFDPANGGQDVGRLDISNRQVTNRAVKDRKKVLAALRRRGCPCPRTIIPALFAEHRSQGSKGVFGTKLRTCLLSLFFA